MNDKYHLRQIKMKKMIRKMESIYLVDIVIGDKKMKILNIYLITLLLHYMSS